MNSHSTPKSNPHQLFAACRTLLCATALVFAVMPSLTKAAEEPPEAIVAIQTATIDGVGDARCSLEVTLPELTYKAITFAKTEPEQLLEKFAAGRSWAARKILSVDRDDEKRKIEIEYEEINVARPVDSGLWQVDFFRNTELQPFETKGNIITFIASGHGGLGAYRSVLAIEVPESGSELQFDAQLRALNFQMPFSQDSVKGSPSLDFRFEVETHVMASAAKSYSNPRFFKLWVARSFAANKGQQTLDDYRVRFRVEGFSSWSRWKRCKHVVPGETIVDAFFPLMDFDKLAKLTSPRPVKVEVQVEYRKPNGDLVAETDSQLVHLLSRNQVMYFHGTLQKLESFYQVRTQADIVIGSFVSVDDPVMQAAAGEISRLAGGGGAGYTDEDAMAFAKATFEYLKRKEIAYTSPTGRDIDGRHCQHIKYGRDVLQNRSGTCIDLSIFYASVFEAVGLDAIVYMTTNHAFPALRLPESKTVIPIEATFLKTESFEHSVEVAQRNVLNAKMAQFKLLTKEVEDTLENRAPAFLYEINIPTLRDQGITSLDQTAMNPLEIQQLVKVDRSQVARNDATNSNQKQPAKAANTSLAGKWTATIRKNGVEMSMGMILAEDGQYGGFLISLFPQSINREIGSYRVDGDRLVLNTDAGNFRRPFELRGNKLAVYFHEAKMWVWLDRQP